jgi:novobiocin biosynthesis protein NovU/D-mycarose 3-C-methyltransferase
VVSNRCRICDRELEKLVDLGEMPPANWLVDSPDSQQDRFPLALDYCSSCGNLQLGYCLPASVLYGHYYYVTPVSTSLDRHYRWLIDTLFERGYASAESTVLEIGSNRGAFLQALSPFVRSTLGVDPAANIVEIALQDGVDTICDYFDGESAEKIASERGRVSLVVARHCMAHNEWPQRMLDGASKLLERDGVLIIENNYAGQMVRDGEFDQIYHEHMFYFSLSSLSVLLERNGFRVIDAEIAAVHGGSIVCVAVPQESERRPHERVEKLMAEERSLLSRDALERFAARTYSLRDELRTLISSLRGTGTRLAAYGATAKGATLLNFCGFTSSEIFACADSTPVKEGRYIPGTGVPIVSEKSLLANPPDYFLLTAWNYKDELIAKTRAAGAVDVRFIVPIPNVEIVPPTD